jgi:hypothetical protein
VQQQLHVSFKVLSTQRLTLLALGRIACVVVIVTGADHLHTSKHSHETMKNYD